jgi:pyruvate dehydrogenase kinase 2/3/4
LYPQELVKFPRPKLPESIQKQLASSVAQNAAGLSGSTQNPSMSEEASSIEEGNPEEDSSPAGLATRERMKKRALSMASSGNGSGSSNGNGGSKRRIPLEHR